LTNKQNVLEMMPNLNAKSPIPPVTIAPGECRAKDQQSDQGESREPVVEPL